MISGDLVREARKRAGLTQAELAHRLGTSQSAVARWERGTVHPSLETLRAIVRGCGFDLAFHMSRADDSSVTIIDEHLRMSTQERFADMMVRVRAAERHRQAARG